MEAKTLNRKDVMQSADERLKEHPFEALIVVGDFNDIILKEEGGSV